ncbi:cysteine desulfurase family protein [Aquibacillus albus]|uniref:Cysteine desulfurase n=1 Tax=Aquibacillus albus TaxID=1168171 RepID=A0ABS2N427_9BACI|nr:cysteine desulfurase family protein [Aquibacillus albus]MBM7572854.1 cysteine desulfurase [Aquibacillus albus]
MIYLDNSATTKPHPDVLDSFFKVSENYFGNPSSVHRFGLEAERLLLTAKQQAAHLLGVSEDEVVFNSGGTEGNNTAIKGIALAHQNRGKHIITSQIEHPSVLEACQALESLGFSVTYLPVDTNGLVSVDDVKSNITENTILISIMHVNNEIGSVQPIEEIGMIAKQYPKLFFHVDHVQGFGKVSLDLKSSGVDLCTISGHKIHGLKGTGLLYIKKNTTLFPLLHGGEQELNYRSGTENLAGIVSLVKAMRLILEEQKVNKDNLVSLQSRLRKYLKTLDSVIINSPEGHSPHILNFSIPGYKPEVVIHALGEKGVYISTKSACSSKKPDESAVLAACGLGNSISESALRVSLSYENNEKEMDTFFETLSDVIKQLSEVMG